MGGDFWLVLGINLGTSLLHYSLIDFSIDFSIVGYKGLFLSCI